MAFDYSEFVELARELTAEFGRTATYVRNSQTPLDANKPWEATDGVETTVDLNSVFVPPASVRQFGLTALGEGTEFKDLISFSEQIVILFPEQEDVRQFTHVIDQGERWGVVGTQVLRPGPELLLAFMGIRR